MSSNPDLYSPAAVDRLAPPSSVLQNQTSDGAVGLYAANGAGRGGAYDADAGDDTTGGRVQLTGGTSSDGTHGAQVRALGGTDGGAAGDVVLSPGAAGSGRVGLVLINHIPTSDPGVSGALWSSSGTVKVSP
jgi:hypothetical protein